ncbi:MAG: DHH family phosphoesterase [Candidatus Verstraetearchaeota archaeon]|nr:DHH family phosphoesterase [Candidatus Verstraetearchaeota archaeon]
MPDLLDFLSSYGRVVLLCHPNADPDCIGSAYAIQSALRARNPSVAVSILAPEGVNAASSKLVEYLSIDFAVSLDESCGLLVLIDMPSLDQLPDIKEIVVSRKIPYAIIDHHTEEPGCLDGAVYSRVMRTSSACEIVYRSIPKKYLDRRAIQALLTGLIYDSRRFLIQPNASIKAASKMLRRGADFALALEMLLNEQDISERIARLKGVARVKLYRARDWIFATSIIGAFEASVARSLTDLGADLAIVASSEDNTSRITGRLNERFQRSTSLNLASCVMHPLAERFSGTGGGHPSAASAKLSAPAEEVIGAALALISEKLGLKPGEMKEISTRD